MGSNPWEEIYKQQEIGEFMTTWPGFPRQGLEAWSTRRKTSLMDTARSTHYTPKFRPFDMLAAPNEKLVILENDYHRIGVESVVGVQDAFHRYIDCDMIYFQYCGDSSIETEFGVYDLQPGELLLVPGGIAHRSIGRTADTLRYFCLTHEPIHRVMGEDQYTSHTTFQMRRIGGPDWPMPQVGDGAFRGPVIEQMHFWDDGPADYTTVRRNYEDLVGVSRMVREGEQSGVKKLRAFDHFTAVAGKKGDTGTQYLMEAANLRIRTYNIEGEQFAFHRALRSEEVRIQFRGSAVDISELENVAVRPGEITIIPLGIAHSVITDPPEDTSFLRLNFYSSQRWRVPINPDQHLYDSQFEITTSVHQEAEWRTQRVTAATPAT